MKNYLVKKEVVSACLKRLRRRKTHEHFAGYLCLQYRAAASKAIENIQPNFVDFFDDFFKVEGAPLTSPYIKPFISTAPSTSNLWLNRNVAGSYAPSSIRSTFKKVVEVEGDRYSLREHHAKMAFEHLLYSEPINVVDLAIFLYRDFPLVVKKSQIEEIVSIFTKEFGYQDASGALNSDFNILFRSEINQDLNSDSLYPYEP